MWGSIGLVQIRDLIESIENDVTRKPETYGDFFLATLKHKSKRGINASSISDISAIPRATVIRKLKSLEKKKHIIRNKKLEYSSFLFLIICFFFSKDLSFLITVALGMADISEIEEALIPRLDLCFRVAKKKSPYVSGFLVTSFSIDSIKSLI